MSGTKTNRCFTALLFRGYTDNHLIHLILCFDLCSPTFAKLIKELFKCLRHGENVGRNKKQ